MNNHLEYIENYFEGKLIDAEKQSFNTRLQNDEAFAQEVAFYLKAQELAKIEQKNRFLVLNAQITKNKKKPNLFVLGGSFAAAASIIIAFFLFFQTNNFSSQEYASLYAKEHFSTLSTQMSDDTSALSKGIELYNQKKYAEALPVFSTIENNPQAIEYQGLCYFQNKQFDKAIEHFQQLATHTELLQNKGNFYTALSYMVKGDDINAKNLLKKIANSADDVFGKEEANKILHDWK